MKSSYFSARGLCPWLMLAALGSPTAQAADYNISTYSRPGTLNTSFWGINNSGQIAGSTYDGTAFSGFVYSSGTFTSLAGPTGSVENQALGISDGGVVVGSYFTGPTDPELGFIYESGSYTSFNVLGATSTTLRGISPDGRYLSGTFDEASSSLNGFLFDRTNGALVRFGAGTIVQGMNSHGVLVGSFFMGLRTPFTYDITTGIRTDYGPENDRYRDINDDGLIAGFRAGTALVGRPGSFQNLAVAGAISTFAEGINNAGWVVGGYTDATGMVDNAFIARPVPEPGSWALLLGGLAAVGVSTRRRRA